MLYIWIIEVVFFFSSVLEPHQGAAQTPRSLLCTARRLVIIQDPPASHSHLFHWNRFSLYVYHYCADCTYWFISLISCTGGSPSNEPSRTSWFHFKLHFKMSSPVWPPGHPQQQAQLHKVPPSWNVSQENFVGFANGCFCFCLTFIYFCLNLACERDSPSSWRIFGEYLNNCIFLVQDLFL